MIGDHRATPGPDEPSSASRGLVYVSVHDFAATPLRPDGVAGIVAVDPLTGGWRLVVARKGKSSGPRLARSGGRMAFADAGRDPTLWIGDGPDWSVLEHVAQLSGHASFAIAPTGDEFFVGETGPTVRGTPRAGLWRIGVGVGESSWTRLPLAGKIHVHDVAPAGDWLLITREMDWMVRRVRPDGTECRNLTPPEQTCLRARFSPDGRQIVYAATTDDGESLWIMDIARRERYQVLPEAPVTIVASWAPDGAHLAVKLCDCVRNERGTLSVPRDLAAMNPRIEIITLATLSHRPLGLPLGGLILGDWVPDACPASGWR